MDLGIKGDFSAYFKFYTLFWVTIRISLHALMLQKHFRL